MAKTKSKKKAKKRAGKKVRRAAAKSAAKGKGGAKSKKGDARGKSAGKKKKADALKPKAIKTGKGMSPAEVGAELVRMFNAGQFAEIEERFWSPKITSIEGAGVSMAWEGRKAVRAKNEEWMADHVIHGGSAEGPYVGATGFAVKFSMDVETKSTGERMQMSEIGVYTVKNGKITTEEFMYGV